MYSFTSSLRKKGLDSINKASEARGLQLRRVPGQKVHTKCRKIHCSQSSIVHATRPRVVFVPLQLVLGVQLHHHFRSMFLVGTHHSHDFAASEVNKFEKSAAVNEGTDIPHFREETFVQYVADNVDHNIHTLDGHTTFYGTGMG